MIAREESEPVSERVLSLVERLGRGKRIAFYVSMIETQDKRMIDEALLVATWLGDPIPVDILRQLCAHRAWDIRYSAFALGNVIHAGGRSQKSAASFGKKRGRPRGSPGF